MERGKHVVQETRGNCAGPANNAGRKERAGSQRYKGERREAKADPSPRENIRDAQIALRSLRSSLRDFLQGKQDDNAAGFSTFPK